MGVTFDPAKRRRTLQARGVDMAEADRLFSGVEYTQVDDRFDYPESRFQTYGLLHERLVMIAWTPIEGGIHVISMRKCNDREQRKFAKRLGRR